MPPIDPVVPLSPENYLKYIAADPRDRRLRFLQPDWIIRSSAQEETIMAQSISQFEEVLEVVETLPLDDQELLVDLVRQRVADK